MGKDTQVITTWLPRDLYEWLRREAFERRTSMMNLVVEALTEKREASQ